MTIAFRMTIAGKAKGKGLDEGFVALMNALPRQRKQKTFISMSSKANTKPSMSWMTSLRKAFSEALVINKSLSYKQCWQHGSGSGHQKLDPDLQFKYQTLIAYNF